MPQISIFVVMESFHNSDGDGWQHWIDYSPVSYHSTKESANTKVKALIQRKIDAIPECVDLNPHIDADYWEVELWRLQTNCYSIDEYGDDVPFYFVDTITTED